MLIIPPWFTKPEWVCSFDDLRVAISAAHKKRQARDAAASSLAFIVAPRQGWQMNSSSNGNLAA